MRIVIWIVAATLLLAGCGGGQDEIVDNGKPGEIRAMVFLDENGNGARDEGEPGLQERVGLSQQISCPPTDLDSVIELETDANGDGAFKELKAGKYCVSLMEAGATTTRLTHELNLSSEQVLQVSFGKLTE